MSSLLGEKCFVENLQRNFITTFSVIKNQNNYTMAKNFGTTIKDSYFTLWGQFCGQFVNNFL